MTPDESRGSLNLLSVFSGRTLAMSEEGLHQLRLLSASVPMGGFEIRGDSADSDDDRPTYFKPYRLGGDRFGNPVPKMFIRRDGVAVVPVKGMTTKGVGNLADYMGWADYDRIQDWLQIAANHEDVRAIALFIDSPGGMTTGSIETANAVVRAAEKKPVLSFVDNLAASAAFKISAGADMVFSTPSAALGSVGTFSYIPDYSEFWREMGIEWLVFRSGQFKGAGIDKVSEEQKAELQREVDYLGDQFRSFIRSRRTGIKDDDMQGQVYFGADAVDRGFSHALAENFEEAISRFTSLQPNQKAS